jgi:hypothetical protein
MSEAMHIPSRECNLSAVDILSIAVKLSIIKKEILNASFLTHNTADFNIFKNQIVRGIVFKSSIKKGR